MREAYVRYEWSVAGLDISVGLQWHSSNEPVKLLWRGLRQTVAPVLAACQSTEADDMTLTIEAALKRDYPDRAYFIEVSDEGFKWTQVYDPRGFVKERCTCPCTVSKSTRELGW